MHSLFFENVRKIAILRANALGDFIVTLPAIEAIKATYPKAEIVLLGKLWHKSFLKQKQTPIDRVVVLPPINGITDSEGANVGAESLNDLFSGLQQEKFDIAIHFQGKGMAANPFLKRLKARLTVGFSCPEAEALDRMVPYYYYQSEVMRYLEAASLVGATAYEAEPKIKVTVADRLEAERFLVSQFVNKSYIVLHCCAVDIRRMWPLEKFASLADRLMKEGWKVIFTGSEADSEQVTEIVAEVGREAINACGKLSLNGLAGLLSGSSLVVSSDTGPLHLARAVGAKTVGIYWAPNLINWGPLSRTKHRPVVSWAMHCPFCGVTPNNPYPFEPKTADCEHLTSFVKDVTVEEVYEKAMELLGNERKKVKEKSERLKVIEVEE